MRKNLNEEEIRQVKVEHRCWCECLNYSKIIFDNVNAPGEYFSELTKYIMNLSFTSNRL